MAFRDFRSHPARRFSELLRRSTGRGGAAPQQEPPARSGASARSALEAQPRKPVEPMAEHRKRGRPVRRVEIERAHGGHIVTVHYHPKKGKKGQPTYEEPERHVHETLDGAHEHVRQMMGDMEPDQADSRELAEAV